MIDLSPAQRDAVATPGNVLVTACPGSGKTRVLTARVLRGLEALPSGKHRVLALTFTNRAADEMLGRLDDADVDLEHLWCGTVHSFALEWVLRPYASYLPETRLGFSVADDYYTRTALRELRVEVGADRFLEVNLRRDRKGETFNGSPVAQEICDRYRRRLSDERLIDYDDILYLGYSLLRDIPEAAETLRYIFRLVCVDEVQDTQDLQFGIISGIARSPGPPMSFFLVGDPNQAIYEGLGAVCPSADELRTEFDVDEVRHVELTGNYRSTQRIIDYYQAFAPGTGPMHALGSDADASGRLTFDDQTVSRDELPDRIVELIRSALEEGVPEAEICVVAPQWSHVRAIARALVRRLPEVSFDAPGLSPLHSQRDNLWFKISRLFLSEPSPGLFRTRLRWAGEVIRDIEATIDAELALPRNRARAILRIVNSVELDIQDGLEYLGAAFSHLMEGLEVDGGAVPALRDSRALFFGSARERIESAGGTLPVDVGSLRRLFRHPAGVVISSCHGVKGEEYDTVIAFGLLRGYIPHWDTIIHHPALAEERSNRLLYVVCSRAGRRLHLISESGRRTGSGRAYDTTPELARHSGPYD